MHPPSAIVRYLVLAALILGAIAAGCARCEAKNSQWRYRHAEDPDAPQTGLEGLQYMPFDVAKWCLNDTKAYRGYVLSYDKPSAEALLRFPEGTRWCQKVKNGLWFGYVAELAQGSTQWILRMEYSNDTLVTHEET